MSETPTPLLVVDIDGTIREGKDDPLGKFVNGPEDVRVFPQAVERMYKWREGGGRIIGLSNQGGIALGLVPIDDVIAAMIETSRQADLLFDKITFCMHHPDADNLEMARCWCRKPAIGGLVDAALNLAHRHNEIYPPWMGLFVGDRPEDEECARRASFDFMWAKDWRK